jgi:hypothetical protein
MRSLVRTLVAVFVAVLMTATPDATGAQENDDGAPATEQQGRPDMSPEVVATRQARLRTDAQRFGLEVDGGTLQLGPCSRREERLRQFPGDYDFGWVCHGNATRTTGLDESSATESEPTSEQFMKDLNCNGQPCRYEESTGFLFTATVYYGTYQQGQIGYVDERGRFTFNGRQLRIVEHLINGNNGVTGDIMGRGREYLMNSTRTYDTAGWEIGYYTEGPQGIPHNLSVQTLFASYTPRYYKVRYAQSWQHEFYQNPSEPDGRWRNSVDSFSFLCTDPTTGIGCYWQ